MTQEQIEKAIATFLIKAVEGDWNSKRFSYIIDCIKNTPNIEVSFLYLDTEYQQSFLFSSNDQEEEVKYDLDALISHHESDEVSFVEALCSNDSSINESVWQLQTAYNQSLCNAIRCEWSVLFTSQRLTWFLDIFKHLLQ